MSADLAAPPRTARRVSPTWRALAAGGPARPPLDPAALAALPAPARRWLTRAVAADRPAAATTLLAMHGRILIGAWRPFTARQVITAGRGYVWAATARFGPVPVLGYDRCADGAGEMRWRLAGVVPVMSAADEDVRRSAAGRLAAEIVLTPGGALDPCVRWQAVDEHRALATVDGAEHAVTIEVDEDGTVRSVRLPRWGDPTGRGPALHEFVVRCDGDREHDGIRLPARFSAGWRVDGDVAVSFEAEIDAASTR
jgi:hypothetical protein